MLLVPFLAGVGLAGPGWVQLPVLVAWLGGYGLSYYALLAVKTGRPDRVAAQLVGYATVTGLAAMASLLARPALLGLAPALLALLAVNAWYSRRRGDRAVLNGAISAVGGSLGVLLAALAAAQPRLDAAVWAGFVVLALYFVGTVLFVKTMIRERGHAGYLRLSLAWHAAAVLPATVISWPFGLLFVWLTARAAWLPRRRLRPGRVGMLELAHSLVLMGLVVGLLGRGH